MAIHNPHIPTPELKQRVIDLASAGIPQYLIAKIIKIDDDTLRKHYSDELECALPEVVARIGKVVAMQALEGDSKAQALYLKTLGAKYGWIEKQVIESTTADDTKELKEKLKELESKFERDY